MAGATYSADALLHLLHSDGADELRLRAGQPPVLVMDGEQEPLDGPALTPEEIRRVWQGVSTTRHRRLLREQGAVEFIHRFRGRTTFIVRASTDGSTIEMVIQ